MTAVPAHRLGVLVLWSLLPPVLRQAIRFCTVSATALIVDISAYTWLVDLLPFAALAAFLAYSLGAVWHYTLSSAVVFRAEMPPLPLTGHIRRFGRYYASTLGGLATTALVVALMVDTLGYHSHVGKLVAIPLSFLCVFTMVRLTVFQKPGPSP